MWPGPHAGQLGAVIGDEGGGLAALGGHRSADARTGERRICHRSEAFAGKVLDDGVDAKPPPAARLIVQKSSDLSLVRALR
jgi:hypothetical protein